MNINLALEPLPSLVVLSGGRASLKAAAAAGVLRKGGAPAQDSQNKQSRVHCLGAQADQALGWDFLALFYKDPVKAVTVKSDDFRFLATAGSLGN